MTRFRNTQNKGKRGSMGTRLFIISFLKFVLKNVMNSTLWNFYYIRKVLGTCSTFKITIRIVYTVCKCKYPKNFRSF